MVRTRNKHLSFNIPNHSPLLIKLSPQHSCFSKLYLYNSFDMKQEPSSLDINTSQFKKKFKNTNRVDCELVLLR